MKFWVAVEMQYDCKLTRKQVRAPFFPLEVSSKLHFQFCKNFLRLATVKLIQNTQRKSKKNYLKVFGGMILGL